MAERLVDMLAEEDGMAVGLVAEMLAGMSAKLLAEKKLLAQLWGQMLAGTWA